MRIFERPYNSIDELHETELEYHRLMFEGGNPIAVPAAMHYCAKYGLNAQPWMIEGSADLMCRLLNRAMPKQRGRSAGITFRYRQHMIDYDRWSAVQEVRENREYLKREIDSLRNLKGVKAKAIREQLENKLKELGTGDLATFECASERLAGTPSKGGPDAIKKSYRKVEKANSNKTLSYLILHPEFVRLVGAELMPRRSEGRKSPLFVA